MTLGHLFPPSPLLADAERIRLNLEPFTRDLAIEVFRTITRRNRVTNRPPRKGGPSSLKIIGEKYGIAWDDKSILHSIAGCAVLRSCIAKEQVLSITKAAIDEAINRAA